MKIDIHQKEKTMYISVKNNEEKEVTIKNIATNETQTCILSKFNSNTEKITFINCHLPEMKNIINISKIDVAFEDCNVKYNKNYTYKNCTILQ